MTSRDVLGKGLSAIYVVITLTVLVSMAVLLSLGHLALFTVSRCGRVFGSSVA
ncbi:hypothetical protein [Gordonia polyisoprenivorans]|uniref:hypothetical protein n=1 Tax=Gordonia polyisoprenivorans TaxID=84595 RepID=UPI001AD7D12D|nr:hypothetical protein [Gordonia polyisoprenivorans]QTI69894.1 hypothetical protein J6U32_04670 [Gordonia polyisoprenivorans]